MMEKVKISLSEASKLFNLPYAVLYLRLKNKKYYPKIQTEKGRAFLYLEDCQPIIEAEKEFFKTHIKLSDVNKTLFGRKKYNTLLSIWQHNRTNYNFLPIIKFMKVCYIKKADFQEFFESIDQSRLVKIAYVNKYLRLTPYELNLALDVYEFKKYVRYVTFAENGRKFFLLKDIKEWLRLKNII